MIGQRHDGDSHHGGFVFQTSFSIKGSVLHYSTVAFCSFRVELKRTLKKGLERLLGRHRDACVSLWWVGLARAGKGAGWAAVGFERRLLPESATFPSGCHEALLPEPSA